MGDLEGITDAAASAVEAWDDYLVAATPLSQASALTGLANAMGDLRSWVEEPA